jgi:hypothetical protein
MGSYQTRNPRSIAVTGKIGLKGCIELFLLIFLTSIILIAAGLVKRLLSRSHLNPFILKEVDCDLPWGGGGLTRLSVLGQYCWRTLRLRSGHRPPLQILGFKLVADCGDSCQISRNFN